jgi:hypothetical protein
MKALLLAVLLSVAGSVWATGSGSISIPAIMYEQPELMRTRELPVRIPMSLQSTSGSNADAAIDGMRTVASMDYRDEATGEVTIVTQDITTVPDTVYLNFMQNVASLSCSGSTLVIRFKDAAASSSGLRFGSKPSHWKPGVLVTGGSQYMCALHGKGEQFILAEVEEVAAVEVDDTTALIRRLSLRVKEAEAYRFFQGVSHVLTNTSVITVPTSIVKLQSGKLVPITRTSVEKRLATFQSRADSVDCSISLSGASCKSNVESTGNELNINYDTKTGQAKDTFMSLSDNLPSGSKVGCVGCFLYYGVTFEAGVSVKVALSIEMGYLMARASGQIKTKFDLVASYKQQSSSAQALVAGATVDSGSIKQFDAKAYVDQLKSFSSELKVATDKPIIDTPTMSTMLTVSITGLAIPVKIHASMGFAAEFNVQQNIDMYAQAGAFASFQGDTALAIFGASSGSRTNCQNFAPCKAAMTTLKVMPSQVASCDGSASSDTCSNGYYIYKGSQTPDVKFGLIGPTLKMASSQSLSVGVTIYPIIRVSLWSLVNMYAVPAVSTTLKAQAGSDCLTLSFTDPELKQIYVYGDVILTGTTLSEVAGKSCLAFCNSGVKVYSTLPPLLSGPVKFTLPSSIPKSFCVPVGLNAQAYGLSTTSVQNGLETLTKAAASIDLSTANPTPSFAATLQAAANALTADTNAGISFDLAKELPSNVQKLAGVLGSAVVTGTLADGKTVSINIAFQGPSGTASASTGEMRTASGSQPILLYKASASGSEWVSVPSSDYKLTGGKVTYNGPLAAGTFQLAATKPGVSPPSQANKDGTAAAPAAGAKKGKSISAGVIAALVIVFVVVLPGLVFGGAVLYVMKKQSKTPRDALKTVVGNIGAAGKRTAAKLGEVSRKVCKCIPNRQSPAEANDGTEMPTATTDNTSAPEAAPEDV